MEQGSQRWRPDSPQYLAHIREVEDGRRKELIMSMHTKCSERWFLLQLMKKYAGMPLLICVELRFEVTVIKFCFLCALGLTFLEISYLVGKKFAHY